MTLLTHKKLTYISLLSGLVLGVLSTLYANYVAPSMNVVFALLVPLLVVIVLGFGVGRVLKDKLSNSYLVSVFALLFTYALSNLIAITKNIHYLLYILPVAIIALGMFNVSNWFFSRSRPSNTMKAIIAAGLFVVVAIVCSAFGLYISRLAFS